MVEDYIIEIRTRMDVVDKDSKAISAEVYLKITASK
jgi:hypothetical protein